MQRRINFKIGAKSRARFGTNSSTRAGSRRARISNTKKPFKLNKTSLIGYSSLGMLGLLTIAMLLPMSSSNTNALDNAMDTAETRVKVKAAASVSLALADQVELDITPSSAGSFASASTRLSVTTNNPEGYKLFLSTKNGNNALLGAAAEISSITSDKTGNEFSQEGDVWGYSLTQGETAPDIDSIYHQIPTTATLAYDQDTATTVLDEHHYNLGFGVHVTPSLLAGEYSNSVVVSVVANPNTITRLDQLVYMQDMTSAICEATPSAYNHDTSTVDRDSPYYLEPVTKQLYDIRDGNMYWVAKLADGNCWMTQNLALNLGERPVDAPASYSRYVKTLTPGDSDVVSEWTVPVDKSTEINLPNPAENDSSDMRSWNLGHIVRIKPTEATKCPVATIPDNGLTYPAEDGFSAAYTGQSIVDNCPEYYSNASNEDDAHYLLGNYYQWLTTTAGSGFGLVGPGPDSEDGEDIPLPESTICPKGWTLPVSARRFEPADDPLYGIPYDTDGSFYHLVKSYGYDKDWSNTLPNRYMPISIGNDPSAAPMYFTRGGDINVGYGALRYVSDYGIYWSKTITATLRDNAYRFIITADKVYPAWNFSYHVGLSVRCLAR